MYHLEIAQVSLVACTALLRNFWISYYLDFAKLSYDFKTFGKAYTSCTYACLSVKILSTLWASRSFWTFNLKKKNKSFDIIYDTDFKHSLEVCFKWTRGCSECSRGRSSRSLLLQRYFAVDTQERPSEIAVFHWKPKEVRQHLLFEKEI